MSENILPSAEGQNNVRFSRCYRTCTVNIYLTQSITFGTSYKWIATVPADARPANDLYAPVFDSAGNPLGGTLCIARDGNVGIKLSATATPFVLTSIAWVV